MPGIPNDLYLPLQTTLLECGPFNSNEQLRDVFSNELIAPWRNLLREATNRSERVSAVISLLKDKRRTDIQTNALVLFLNIVRDLTHPSDSCYNQLNELAQKLDASFQGGDTHIVKESNPQNQHMIFTADWLQLIDCVRAVGKVKVPKIEDGKLSNQFSTGTGWLVAPRLLLTCWHVIEARELLDDEIDESDLQSQVVNSTAIFDYILPASGTEYGISALECYDKDLDYALLHLHDRADHPLDRLGTLRLDADLPLIPFQTNFYIIQHPKGQPQQNSSGVFIKNKVDQHYRILHSAPTEKGTSGAPVLNTTNWRVAGLHVGENNGASLREATLLKAILTHIEHVCPDLHKIIV